LKWMTGSCRPTKAWTERSKRVHSFVRRRKIDELCCCCRQQQYHPVVAVVEMSRMFLQRIGQRKLHWIDVADAVVVVVVVGVPACWAW